MKQQLVYRLSATLSVIAAALASSIPAANATVITGNLHITGAGQVAISRTPPPGNVGIIDFQSDSVLPGHDVNPAGDGTGRANIVSGSTGAFAGLALGEKLVMRDINTTAVPVGVTGLNYTDFLTFADQPDWSVTLTDLRAGIFNPIGCLGAAAPGQTCSLPGAPFNFINTGTNSSVVSAVFDGIAIDATDPSNPTRTNVTGTFEATFSNLNFQQLLAGGAVTTSYSATITAVPEPSTATMLIGALLVAGMVAGRRLVG